MTMPSYRSHSITGRLQVLISTILFLSLSRVCRSDANASTTSIYQELESLSIPEECHRSVRTNFFLETTKDEYRLVVNVPKKVTRKNMKIDIDYNLGEIEMFGWWTQRKIRGESPRKMCVYHRWKITDTALLGEEAVVSVDLVSVYDMVMSLKDHQLILSLPKSVCSTPASPPPPSPITTTESIDGDGTDAHISIVIAYGTSLWKKLRGLSRLKDHSRHYANYPVYQDSDAKNSSHGSENAFAYLQSRHKALEHFLTYSMGTIAQEFY